MYSGDIILLPKPSLMLRIRRSKVLLIQYLPLIFSSTTAGVRGGLLYVVSSYLKGPSSQIGLHENGTMVRLDRPVKEMYSKMLKVFLPVVLFIWFLSPSPVSWDRKLYV